MVGQEYTRGTNITLVVFVHSDRTLKLNKSWDGPPYGHNMGRKVVGGCCAHFGGAGSPSNTMSPTSVSSGILIHPAVWPQQREAENCSLLGMAGSPYNTMWPGLRPIYIPSCILIHPAVWPHYTNVIYRQTDRQDRQDREKDNGPAA